MARTSTRVIIYDSAIEAMSLPGGQVYRWGRQKAMRMRTLARRNVGKRTGALRASIYSEYNKVHNGAQFFVGTRTGYGVYVHEGTGPQFGKRRMDGHPGRGSKGHWRPGMQHGLSGGVWPSMVRGHISGQVGQKFLQRAMREVLRGYR